MKTICLTVEIIATVPDDAPLRDLCLELDVASVSVVHATASKTYADGVDEYTTVSVRNADLDAEDGDGFLD